MDQQSDLSQSSIMLFIMNVPKERDVLVKGRPIYHFFHSPQQHSKAQKKKRKQERVVSDWVAFS